jgi:hypothetical protein
MHLVGFMGIEVVKYDMDFLVGIVGNHLVHKVEKLSSPASLVMACFDQTACDVECGK